MKKNPFIVIDRFFPSERSVINEIPEDLSPIKEECGISDRSFFNLVLALTEAVTNAVVHGNHNDRSKQVHMVVECLEDQIRCLVEDEGEGFDPEEIADPLAPENIMNEGGRGVFLIRSLANSLRIDHTDRGTSLEFYFTVD